MTKKDFLVVAGALSEAKPEPLCKDMDDDMTDYRALIHRDEMMVWRSCVFSMITFFEKVYPRFDKAIFYARCVANE